MKWYLIEAKQGEPRATILVYDEIGGGGTNGKRFMEEARALTADTIDLLINSPGGSVFDALLMFNGLRALGKTINVKIMGVAASAASYLAMAGDKITMPRNTFQFVHNPIAGLYGNAEDMREMADMLDKTGVILKATYAKRTKLDEAKLTELFANNSYLTADECLALGLCDEVTDEVAVEARFDLDRPDLPAHVRQAFEAAKASIAPPAAPPEPTPPAPHPAASMAAQISAVAGEFGLSDHVAAFATDPKLDTIEAVRAAVIEAVEVRELCALVGRPADAAGHIVARRSLAEVRSALQTVLVSNDESRHTSNIPAAKTGGEGDTQTPGFSPSAFWKRQAAPTN